MYAGIGVLLTYLYVITFFTACLTLDQKRIDENRNGTVPCIIHKNVKKSQSERFSKKMFHAVYSRLIFTWPGKLFVVLITVICLGVSAESIFKLEQRFDPRWFIPSRTYLHKYLKAKESYYPTLGFETGIYIGRVNYAKEINKVKEISEQLDNSTDIINDIISWVDPFYDYVQITFDKGTFPLLIVFFLFQQSVFFFFIDLRNSSMTELEFSTYISKFLFSKYGSRFAPNFRFKRELKCGSPAPEIVVFKRDI